MAQYRVIQRSEPGVMGGGNRRWYAVAVSARECSIDELTKKIEQQSTVNGADICAVLYVLVDVSIEALKRGKIVRLGDLGSIKLSLSSKGKDNAYEVRPSSIKKTTIVYTPGKRLKTMLTQVTYTKRE